MDNLWPWTRNYVAGLFWIYCRCPWQIEDVKELSRCGIILFVKKTVFVLRRTKMALQIILTSCFYDDKMSHRNDVTWVLRPIMRHWSLSEMLSPSTTPAGLSIRQTPANLRHNKQRPFYSSWKNIRLSPFDCNAIRKKTLHCEFQCQIVPRLPIRPPFGSLERTIGLEKGANRNV